MAVTKTILKLTNQEAVVKVAGTSGSATITLATDLLTGAGQALDGSTQTVNIVKAITSGLVGSAITVARNSVNILTVAGENAGVFDLNSNGFVDTIQNTKDIVVSIGSVESQIYLVLRKVGGYKTTIEIEQFGPYDDPEVAGS